MKTHSVGGDLFDACRLTGGWTDRHDEANSSFSQFCRFAERLSISSIWHFTCTDLCVMERKVRLYVVCPKSSCSMFIKILFYKF